VLDMLTRTNANGERFPIAVALGIAVGAAQGLAYAHDRRSADGSALGIVHRDVSPANLMVSFEGVVKVLDFGVAKARSRSTETEAGTIMGKIAYLSPEQCNTANVDHRSDQFSLGIVLYEMLTHQRPFKRATDYETFEAIVRFDPPPPSTINRDLPLGLDDVVLRALSKSPADRYDTTHALIEALEQVADDAGIALAQRDLKKFMRNLYGTPPEPWRTLAVAEDSMGMFQGEVIGPLGPETELRFFPPDANANDVPLLSQPLTPLGTPGYVHPPDDLDAALTPAVQYKPVPRRLPTDDLVEAAPTPSWAVPPVATQGQPEPSGSLILPAPLRPPEVTYTPTAGIRIPGSVPERRSYRVVAITAALLIGVGVLVFMVTNRTPSTPAATEPAPVNRGITATPIDEPAARKVEAAPATPDAKATAVKTSDPNPAESKAAAVKSSDTKPVETSATATTSDMPTETKATAMKATDPKAAETKAAGVKAADPKPAETKATAVKATDPKAAETKAAGVKATDPKPAETKATAVKATDPKAAETKAPSVKTMDPKPAETKATAVKATDPKATTKAKTGAKAKPACTDPLDCQF
jgi:serine/threonine-protein kinase